MTNYFVALKVNALDRRDVKRRRHVLDDRIKELLYAFVSVCCTAAYRNCLTLAGCFTKNLLHLINGRLLTLKILHHEVIIELADLLNEFAVVKLCIILHIFRNVCYGDIIALIIIVDVSLHLEEVDDSLELVFLTDRELDADRVLAKSCTDLIYTAVEVCTKDIHLVDECHSRYVVGISLTPYVLGLRLYTTLCTENANSAIKYTEGTLNLNSEVYVAWCIDDVDTVLKCASLRLCLFLECPVTSRSCGCDRDTSLLLLLHPVHGSCTFVSITDLIVNTSIIKDTLCRCCLTSIDMSHDSDISGSL